MRPGPKKSRKPAAPAAPDEQLLTERLEKLERGVNEWLDSTLSGCFDAEEIQRMDCTSKIDIVVELFQPMLDQIKQSQQATGTPPAAAASSASEPSLSAPEKEKKSEGKRRKKR